MPELLARRLVDHPLALGPAAVGVVDTGGEVGHLGLGPDVDPQPGEPRGQTGVLALLADRERQLEVRHDHLGGREFLVDPDLLDLRRSEGPGDEVVAVVGERDDVDLLAPELVDDLADPRPASSHAGTDGIDVAVVRGDGDLGPLAGLPGARQDLDDTVGDLGNLELEEPLDEPRVGPGHDDLRTLHRLADLDDVDLDPFTRLGAFVVDLLRLGQEGLDPAQVEQGVPGVRLLDDAGDDVALAPGVLLVLELTLGLADPLAHDLTDRRGRDASEVVRGHVELLTDGLEVLVELLGVDPDLAGLGVDVHPGELVGVRSALVRSGERLGERSEERVDRDPPLGGDRVECFHHVWVHGLASLLVRAVGRDFVDFGGVGWPHSKTVRARSTASIGTSWTTPSSVVNSMRPSPAAVSVPTSRPASSAASDRRRVTRCPTAPAKCASVRRRRSSPGLDTSRVTVAGSRSSAARRRARSRDASARVSMSTPPDRSSSTASTPPRRSTS